MQTIGHVIVNGETVKVLVRPNFSGGYVSLRIRTSGRDGRKLSDESLYLQGEPDVFKELKAGHVVKL